MTISSRTPEGEPNRCPICGHLVHIKPSRPLRDAPCPYCGHLLIFAEREGSISAEQGREVDELAQQEGITVEEAIVRLGYASAEEMARFQASRYEYDKVDLGAMEIPRGVIALIPESVAREHSIIPLAIVDGCLRVAMNNGLDVKVIDKLRFMTNCDIAPVVAPMQAILLAIDQHYGAMQD